jgi:hypothetical protein
MVGSNMEDQFSHRYASSFSFHKETEPVIPKLGRLRQENEEFKTSMDESSGMGEGRRKEQMNKGRNEGRNEQD